MWGRALFLMFKWCLCWGALQNAPKQLPWCKCTVCAGSKGHVEEGRRAPSIALGGSPVIQVTSVFGLASFFIQK